MIEGGAVTGEAASGLQGHPVARELSTHGVPTADAAAYGIGPDVADPTIQIIDPLEGYLYALHASAAPLSIVLKRGDQVMVRQVAPDRIAIVAGKVADGLRPRAPRVGHAAAAAGRTRRRHAMSVTRVRVVPRSRDVNEVIPQVGRVARVKTGRCDPIEKLYAEWLAIRIQAIITARIVRIALNLDHAVKDHARR